jgi:hypothetical protein
MINAVKRLPQITKKFLQPAFFFVNRLKYTSKQNHIQGQLQEKSKRFSDIQLELTRVQMFRIQHSLLFLYCGPFARKTDTTETFL